MKHIRPMSSGCASKALNFSIGYYIVAAGQILGILALMFIDKPEISDINGDADEDEASR